MSYQIFTATQIPIIGYPLTIITTEKDFSERYLLLINEEKIEYHREKISKNKNISDELLSVDDLADANLNISKILLNEKIYEYIKEKELNYLSNSSFNLEAITPKYFAFLILNEPALAEPLAAIIRTTECQSLKDFLENLYSYIKVQVSQPVPIKRSGFEEEEFPISK